MFKEIYRFASAVPVWEKGAAEEKNIHLAFTFTLSPDLEAPILRLAGCETYTVAVDGEFIAYGPARAAYGFFRVDEIALSPYQTDRDVTVSVRVAGYNACSFIHVKQPPFLCAELVDGEEVIAYTSPDSACGIRAYRVTERMRYVQRYSYQRPFVEHYSLTPDSFAYELGNGGEEVELEAAAAGEFLTRIQPYGDYEVVLPLGEVAEGIVGTDESRPVFNDRAIYEVATGWNQGYTPEEFEFASHREVSYMTFSRTASFFCRSAQSVSLAPDGYADIDLGRNYTGLLDFTVDTPGGCELYLLYDEFFGEDGEVDPFRMSSSNIFYYRLAAGSYHIRTTEPYCMRALRIVVRCGSCTVRSLKMFKIAYPSSHFRAQLGTGDEELQKIYEAAVESFSANATDIFMDCPSRERAGWLCDSFFTSRVEKLLTGHSPVEEAHLANFILSDAFSADDRVPKGMLPMCYPGDAWAPTNNYIPNWAMWYVLELEEYLARSGDRELIDAAKERMLALAAWFAQYENEDGLLIDLPSWIFVEWSRANALVQNLNFPTNMVYASMLDAIARLYGIEEFAQKAEKLREDIRRMAMTDSGFFCDNMVRRDGELVLSGECTEACQYYAFFCDIATPESHPELWRRLRDEFGTVRNETKAYPEVWPANAFIGNYLRLEILFRYGATERMEEDIRGFFLPMAEKTGTLWEHMDTQASCNHGFASHVLVWLDRLGYLLHSEEE